MTPSALARGFFRRHVPGLAPLLAIVAIGHTLAADAEDALFPKGHKVPPRMGRVRGIDDTSFKLEILLPGSDVRATVSVPRDTIDRIEFAPDEERDELIAAGDPDDILKIRGLWEGWANFLAIPKSPAGRIGVAYANLLVAEGGDSAEHAYQILVRIESESWSEAHRRLARQCKLRAMLATGRAADAVDDAKAFAIESEDPEVLIEAKHVLASAAHQELLDLVEENPRWQEDVLVRPEVARLVNESLNLYLYPVLFHGSEVEAASRGLWGALEIYRFDDDSANAIACARDLQVFYPDTTFAQRATEFLESQPATQPTENETTDNES